MEPTIFTGRVDSRTKKATLVNLAQALSLDPNHSGKKLVADINDHLKAHPELVSDPRFQGLYVYRPDPTGSIKATKKSSDKASEDAVEAEKGAGEATGANKTLLDLKVTTDPPAQYTRLQTTASAATNYHQGFSTEDADAMQDGNTSPDDFSCTQLEDGDRSSSDGLTANRSKPSVLQESSSNKTVGSIAVSLVDRTGNQSISDEIWLKSQDIPIIEHTRGNQVVYMTSLSKLIPELITKHSPMKGQAGRRLFRSGRIDPNTQIDLGTIESLLPDRISENKRLDISQVNDYELTKDDEGVFSCRLFLGRDGPDNTFGPFRAGVVGAQSPDDYKPLEIVRVRQAANKANRVALKKPSIAPSDPDFKTFLQTLLEIGNPSWTRAYFARQVLVRHKTLDAGYKKLEGMNWGRSKGGYRVPDEYTDFPGQEFTKAHVQSAYNIIASLAGNDASLFDADLLAKVPDAEAWVDNAEGEYKSTFYNMSPAQFKAYVKKAVEEHDDELKQKKEHNYRDYRKRFLSSDEEGDCERGKGKEKSRRRENDDKDRRRDDHNKERRREGNGSDRKGKAKEQARRSMSRESYRSDNLDN
ncbi:hypothetical protein GALMADRAFT_138890 [Galerina marginata CBS 339.88]|uniref:Uncharacterized protein n=1 Tax=Galerina marginata (strain CBS 339.88) TaxID=685588 RepID=A0A067TD72_GALM3|nr:hypothetical protein GALMADRAFT_138890 [Galerina marginata CBS 339.88]